MSDEPPDELPPELTVTDPALRTMLGLFDMPAFARRGAELEYGLERLRGRCRRQRAELLGMVHLRLKQWAGVARGPHDWSDQFDRAVAPYWDLAGAPSPPAWSTTAPAGRRRRAVARDLIASVERFNRRWAAFLAALDLTGLNGTIERYNKYYLVEKEISLGSSRLAARGFEPQPPMTVESLAAEFPALPPLGPAS